MFISIHMPDMSGSEFTPGRQWMAQARTSISKCQNRQPHAFAVRTGAANSALVAELRLRGNLWR